MKKFPAWAYLVIGAVVAIGGLFFWGKYKMKKMDAATPPPTAPVPPPAAETPKTFAGGVLRAN
jgi:hypothetical protein